MRRPTKLLIATDTGAVVSFGDVKGFSPGSWDQLPSDIRALLAWPMDDASSLTSALCVTLESAAGRKLLYAMSGGGPTRVNERSALPVGRDAVFIIGAYVARLDVAAWRVVWRIQADDAICFHLYSDPDDASAVIVHGELQIAKVSLDGALLWQVSGADIFVQPDGSKALTFETGAVVARDWNGWVYTINSMTGGVTVRKPSEGDALDAS